MTDDTKRRRRRRPQKKRRSRGFIYAAFCLIVVGGLSIYSISNFFIVREIKVSGINKVKRQDIVSACGVENGDNLVLLSTRAAANRLYGVSTYIEKVTVRRRLPDTLEIIVVEGLPVAAIVDDDGIWLISMKGKLLEKLGADSPVSLTLIENYDLDNPMEGGPAQSENKTRRETMIVLLKEFTKADMLSDVASVDAEKLYDFTFMYMGRLEVHLGMPEDIGRKLRFLVSLDQAIGQQAGKVFFEDERARFVPENIV